MFSLNCIDPSPFLSLRFRAQAAASAAARLITENSFPASRAWSWRTRAYTKVGLFSALVLMHFPSLLTAELFWCPQLKLSIIRTAANNDQMTLTGFFFKNT